MPNTRRTAPSIHCLHGNLLRAMLDFGFGETSAFSAPSNGRLALSPATNSTTITNPAHPVPALRASPITVEPCAWGAIKALRALARIPEDRRTPQVKKAIRVGVEFLLSRDPAKADYPSGDGRISSSWLKLGFPSGYVADVLQNLQVLAELGHGRDKRLDPAIEWLLSKQDAARTLEEPVRLLWQAVG